jgi:hypothetical protein
LTRYILDINFAILVEKEAGSAEEQPASDRQVPHWNKSAYGRDCGLSHFLFKAAIWLKKPFQ